MCDTRFLLIIISYIHLCLIRLWITWDSLKPRNGDHIHLLLHIPFLFLPYPSIVLYGRNNSNYILLEPERFLALYKWAILQLWYCYTNDNTNYLNHRTGELPEISTFFFGFKQFKVIQLLLHARKLYNSKINVRI